MKNPAIQKIQNVSFFNWLQHNPNAEDQTARSQLQQDGTQPQEQDRTQPQEQDRTHQQEQDPQDQSVRIHRTEQDLLMDLMKEITELKKLNNEKDAEITELKKLRRR